MTVTVEVFRRIYDEKFGEGHYLTVCPDADGLGFIELNSDGCEDYYGKIRLVLNPELAMALSNALLAASAELLRK